MGPYPSRGVFIYRGKNWNSWVFASPKAPRNIFEHSFRNLTIFEHFFEILGKFVIKNAIKSDFLGDLCRSISKIFEKSSFLAKKYFYTGRKFRKYFSTGALIPSTQIALICTQDRNRVERILYVTWSVLKVRS